MPSVKRAVVVARRGAFVLAGVTMASLAVAAFAKGMDLEDFRSSLRTWTLLAPGLHGYVVIIVPMLEAALAACFFLGVKRRFAILGSLVLLFGFTVLYSVQLSLGPPPDCNCFGKLLAYEQGVADGRAAIVRNLVLMGLLVPAVAISFWPVGKARSQSLTRNLRQRLGDQTGAGVFGASRGFTLLETIIVIFVIALLIAILFPAIGYVRRASRGVSDQADLRTHGTTMAAYSADHFGEFLTGSSPDDEIHVFGEGYLRAETVQYFMLFSFWPLEIVAQDYIDGFVGNELFVSSNDPDGDGFGSYHFPCVFIASPEYYSDRRVSGRSQWRATRQDEVVFSSDKVLMARTNRYSRVFQCENCDSVMAAFVDLSVRSVRQEDTAGGWPYGDGGPGGDGLEATIHPSSSDSILHTREGVRGRDTK